MHPPLYEPPRAPKRKVWLHVLLFALTLLSTTWVGGPVYSICVLGILTAHEFGHYFAAKYHRVPATLPYVMPFPLSPLGTLGAVIRMKHRCFPFHGQGQAGAVRQGQAMPPRRLPQTGCNLCLFGRKRFKNHADLREFLPHASDIGPPL
jgi:hypothetical protein